MSFNTYTSIDVDGRVLAFALLASVVTGLLFGVGPALRASRAHGTFLVQDRSALTMRGTSRVRGLLVVAEVALSLVLLVGAALFARSFVALNGVRPGFDADRIVTAEISIPSVRYPTPEQRGAVVASYRDRLRVIPGVTGVSVSTGAPPRSGVTFGERIEAEGGSAPLNKEMVVIPFTEGDTAYFATLGIRLSRGRGFTSEDRSATDRRAVIDPGLARALWPTADPIGRRFRIGPDDPWITVIGVADDVTLLGPDGNGSRYGIYYPLPAKPRATRFVELVVHTSGDPARLVMPIKRAIWSVDPQQPINRVSTARDRMAESIAKPRFLLTLMGVFAGVALVLAVIGLYGVLSHAVAQRTREIGIRMALGAESGLVLRSVLRSGALLTALGVVAGLGLTMAGGRVVRSLLFGVAPLDPVAIAAAAVTLAGAALVACYIPARRATRVDPLVALRAE
jgi:putative ABC transport system permease protein